MNKALLAVALAAFSLTAWAGNDNSNPCGNNGNNCQSGDVTANGGNGYGGSGGTGYGGSGGTGVGLGVGVGYGGESNAVAFGGEGGKGGQGGDGGVGLGFGGAGGDGGSVVGSGNSSNLNSSKAEGGSAYQGQSQGQKQSNVGVNTSQNVLGQSTDASSQNDNRSMGNTTTVGGDTTLVERNAPPVFLGAIMPTNCGGSVQAGGSSPSGSGAFGISFVGKECQMRMIGDRFQQLGQVDVACNVYKATKGFRDAAKVNPKLKDVDCSVKSVPAPVVAPVVPADFHAPRIPRG